MGLAVVCVRKNGEASSLSCGKGRLEHPTFQNAADSAREVKVRKAEVRSQDWAVTHNAAPRKRNPCPTKLIRGPEV